MALINYSFGDWQSWWADGYLLPTKRQLWAYARKTMSHEDLKPLAITAPPASADNIFYSMLVSGSRRSLGDIKERDIFYLNLNNLGPLESYSSISTEARCDSNRELYRGVMLVTRDTDVETMEPILGELWKELGFRLKEEKNYKNYQAFKDDCMRLLDEVTEPFFAPCVLAGERLKSRGFKADLL